MSPRKKRIKLDKFVVNQRQAMRKMVSIPLENINLTDEPRNPSGRFPVGRRKSKLPFQVTIISFGPVRPNDIDQLDTEEDSWDSLL